MNAKELFGRWDTMRKDLFRALDMLTNEQLDFVPRERLWSLGTVARHIAGAEAHWFRCSIPQELPEWPSPYTVEDYPTVD